MRIRLPLLLAALLALVVVMPATAQRMELVWSEEFEGTTLDRSVWTPWVGSAYNNEKQYYREQNVRVADGFLYLDARRQAFSGYAYTSGRVESWPNRGNGATGHAWTYGRFEIRAKMPPAIDGLWPAIWLMPARPRYGGWPYSGEIDIFEWRSHVPAEAQGTIHYACCTFPGSGNGLADRRYQYDTYTLPQGTFAETFHTFGLEWNADGLSWYVDSLEYNHIPREAIAAETYPFDAPFYVILNLAVGGQYIGDRLPPASFQQESMLVDYVHVYQDVNRAPTATLGVPQSALPALTPVHLTAAAGDEDGQVAYVDFYFDDQHIGADSLAPFEIDWTTPTDGCYRLSARATDNDGGRSPRGDSTLVTVGSGCTRAPFGEAPIALPGLLPLAHYDRGGQGVAYYDANPLVNQGGTGTFRQTEGVDLVPAVDGSGAYDLSYVVAGEWTEYTVDVAVADTFDIEVKARSQISNGRVLLELDGQYLTRISRLNPPTGGEAYTTVVATGVALPAGRHVLRMTPERSGINLQSLRFTRATGTASDDVPTAPGAPVLHQSFPNPAPGGVAEIQFVLPAPSEATLALYDVLGRRVAVLASGYRPAGLHRVAVPDLNLPAGLYTYVLTTAATRLSRTMHVVPR